MKTRTSQLVIRLFAVLAVAPAAWGYTYIFNTDTGLPLRWPPGTIAMKIYADNTTTLLDGSTAAQSLQTALQTWNALLGNEQFTWTILSPATLPNSDDGDGVNEVSFASTAYGQAFDSSTLAITTVWSRGNQRAEADTVFNTAWTWNSYRDSLTNHPHKTVDIQRVATHEFGHNLGLDHPDQAMPPQAQPAIMDSIISDITAPTSDDIAGAQNLYGPPPLNSVPANDNFANAINIILNNNAATMTGFNVNATKESGEPNNAANIGGRSVWWKWTAPSDGSVNLDTKGSYNDTTLGVYTGSSVSTLTTIASNDDINPGIVQASALTFNAVHGTTYFFDVDGFNGSDGNGADSSAVTLNLAFTPTSTVSLPPADLNGDGKPDILWENTSTGDRAIWFMNGTAIGSFGYLAGIPTAWHIVGTGDFNGDGHNDILWENTSTGDRSIWLMNGTAISSFAYVAYVDPVWHIAAVADFNGDGKPDIVWENTSTGDRSIWLMNGSTVSSFVYLAYVPTAWRIVGAGDFNGDGKPDLVWENTSTGDRSIWLMNGTTLSSFVYLANVGTAWHIAAVADFNGDGQADLLWENTTTGDRAFWLMSGTARSSSPYLANVPGVWHIAP